MALDGKHALITGSSRGIGRGIALKLAEKGVKVAIHYYQNEAAAKDTLAQVRKRGSDGFVVQADVTRPEPITEMFRKVQGEFGKLDIFVSNARPDLPGFYRRPLDITLEQWHMALDSQARAFLLGAQESARIMRDGGRILARCRQGSDGLARSLLRGGPSATRDHRQWHQSRGHLRSAECG